MNEQKINSQVVFQPVEENKRQTMHWIGLDWTQYISKWLEFPHYLGILCPKCDLELGLILSIISNSAYPSPLDLPNSGCISNFIYGIKKENASLYLFTPFLITLYFVCFCKWKNDLALYVLHISSFHMSICKDHYK